MPKAPEQLKLENIIQRTMDEVMHQSMMPYAEHVILERALPRVEDGLKPVQRRILYTMLELSLSPDKPHRKSARIVGDCLGKYHPHGDSSVYDAMVRMAQPYNMCVPLVDGHGNFGSVDGDSAAAMRYTEARMTPAAMQLLRDIEKETVTYSFNFDDTLKEPDLLPGRFPNLLVNGASGIAVGLATNIPPHNPVEAINAVIAVMNNPRITLEELMKIIPAPDFPTGGFILENSEVELAYRTGRGKVYMRAKTHFEEQKNGKTYIVITELPFQVNKAAMLEKILAVSQEKKALFSGIADIRDESDRTGMRAVIEVKKDGDPERILQYLFKYSDLQMTFGVNMVAIAGGKPQQMNLKQIIAHYIRHQRDVVTRRTQFELDAALRREHILAGLMIAVDNLDAVIALIRASKSPKEAREGLMKTFGLSEAQAQAILDLRLQRLTNMELITIKREYAEVVKLIGDLRSILGSDKKLMALIEKELVEIRAQLAVSRRTTFVACDETPVDENEDLTVVEDVTVCVCEGLKVRKMLTRQFSLAAISEDKPLFVLETKSNQRVRLFTDQGAVLSIVADEIPETRPTTRAANLAALLPFEKNEQIVAVFPDDDEGDYFFYLRDGNVKRTPASEYRVRVKRTAAVSLRDKDRVIGVEKRLHEAMLLVTKLGMSIRFATESVPAMGRVSGGVKCVKLEKGDCVVYAAQLPEEGEILTVTDKGFGKRSPVFDYDLQGRNGKGLKTFDLKKNGANGTCIAGVLFVGAPREFTLTQRHGTKTVLSTNEVHIESRAGKGAMLVAVVLDDDVVSVD
ncbi:MAG TPA: DNA topoisomerase (ATP-hydrolyzing) [Candidatus Cryosericum sp.]|nr:DNA topoisomerase (ATP-hydrolyzing) [Candidatus Cryosericum sp.]